MTQTVTIDATYHEPTTAQTSIADGGDGVFEWGRKCRVLIIRNDTAGRLYWQAGVDTITPDNGTADFIPAASSLEIACLSFTKICIHPVGAAAVFSGATPTASIKAW